MSFGVASYISLWIMSNVPLSNTQFLCLNRIEYNLHGSIFELLIAQKLFSMDRQNQFLHVVSDNAPIY